MILPKNLLKNILLSIIALALSLLVVECVLRVIYPEGIKVKIENIKAFPWLKGDAVLGWKNISGYHMEGLNINSLGMRGPEISLTKKNNILRILCIGDSRTFGIWSSKTKPFAFDSQYPEELKNLLQASCNQKSFEVLNLGVIGYTSAHVLRLINTGISKLNPDVLIIGVGFNDILKSWDPGMRTQEPKSKIMRFLLYSCFRTRITQLILAGSQANPFRPKPFTTRWVEPQEYRYNITRIIETAREMKIPLFLIHQPLRTLRLGENLARKGARDNGMKFLYFATGVDNLTAVHHLFNQYRDILFAVANDLNTPVLDLKLAFKDKEELVFDMYDLVHYNSFGAKLVAQAIKIKLQQLKWIPSDDSDEISDIKANYIMR